ncbi:hypothetical protein [Acidilobus sp.]|uniref:hypothetical protein n=1 Tax=Acidilobus sp. TaxID=1872109 RepID=UPI003D00C4BA
MSQNSFQPGLFVYAKAEGVVRKETQEHYIAIGYDDFNNVIRAHWRYVSSNGQEGYRFISARPSKEVVA